jgi:protein subunit release factor A
MPSALRPPPYATDARTVEAETRVDVFTAGGPGGQHRNKTQNAVRLHHVPSGVVVTATERRSLEANRRAAFDRLVERLERLNFVPKKRKATRPSRGAVERRLAGKKQASRNKQQRRQRFDD